jgi:hypothetical protein
MGDSAYVQPGTEYMRVQQACWLQVVQATLPSSRPVAVTRAQKILI